MNYKRIRAVVRGTVQGVAFREHTRQEAVKRGLAGWVCNQPDGTVALVCEGETAQVEALLVWLALGSPASKVDAVDWQEEELQGESGPFIIRFLP